jgi:hypothetical protein
MMCSAPPAGLCCLDRGAQTRIVEKAAVGNCVLDPGEVLENDSPGADVHVAYLGIAHLAGG